jgi:vacuolar-type H+-ATPase subunit C/Vma6
VSIDFTDLNARASGLRDHLFPRAELETLAALSDVSEVAHALAVNPRLPLALSGDADLAQIEAAVRRTAAHYLRVLSHWCTDRPAALEVFEAQQDRRSVRALLRGAVQGASARARLVGLTPSTRLPERLLVRLARMATPREVLAHLFAAGHPYAESLLPLADAVRVDLVELELALIHACARRMRACVRAADRALRDYVREQIDFENAQTALLLCRGGHDLDVDACFVDGGSRLTRASFEVAARSSPDRCAPMLAQALAGTALSPLFRSAPAPGAALDAQALTCLLSHYRRAALIDPLSSAPLILFMLRLQAQCQDLLGITYGVGLGLPPARMRTGLVTPWN